MTEAVPVGLPIARTNPLDPPPELGRLREVRPISRMTYPDGHLGWLVTGHSAARKVLTDPRFSSRGELLRSPVDLPRGAAHQVDAPPGMFIRLDPPEHTRYRR